MTVQVDIKPKDFGAFKEFLNKIKGQFVVIEEEDDTKMTKEEYFAMIDDAREEEGVVMSIEDIKAKYL